MRYFLFLFLFVSVTGCSGTSTPAENIQRAQEFQEQGEFNSAIIELKNSLVQEPNNIEARTLLGQIYLELEDWQSAEKELRRSSVLGVVAGAIALPLAKALLGQGKYDSVLNDTEIPVGISKTERADLLAIQGHAALGLLDITRASQLYKSALDISSQSLEAKLGMARLEIQNHHYDEARTWLDRVFELHPNLASAWSLLGDIERREGNPKLAEESYGKAIHNRQNNLGDHYKRALVRIYSGNLETAAEDINTLTARAPTDYRTAYATGVLSFSRKEYQEAQAQFELVLHKAPNDTLSFFYLGVAHAQQAHWEQANIYLSKFLAAYPDVEPTTKLLGAIRIQQGNYSGAEKVLKPLTETYPDDMEALNLLSAAVLRQGKTQEGIEYLGKVVAKNTDSSAAYMQLGLGLLSGGEAERGIEALEKAVELDPTAETAELLLLQNYLSTGEFDKALETAEEIKQQQPENPLPLNLEGLAYLGKGNVEKARASFASALKLSPGFPPAGNNLAVIELRQGNAMRARDLYLEIVKHHPRHYETLLKISTLEATLGNQKDSLIWLEKAVDTNPDAFEPRVRLAEHYLVAGKQEEALLLLLETPPEYSQLPRFLATLGRAQMANKEYRKAVSTLEKLVEIKPESDQAYAFLSQAKAALGDRVGSREAMDKVLAINPGHIPAKIAKTRLLIQENKFEEAEKLLTELQSARPDDPAILRLSGNLALSRNQPERAISAYRKAVEKSPDRKNVIGLALMQVHFGDTEPGLATLKGWINKHNDDVLAKLKLADIYESIGRTDSAIEVYDELLNLNPDSVVVNNNLATLVLKKDPERALTYAKRALDLDPENPGVMDTLAVAYMENNQAYLLAQRLLENASAQQPNNRAIRVHLARALSLNNKNEEARSILNELLESGNPFPERNEATALLRELNE